MTKEDKLRKDLIQRAFELDEAYSFLEEDLIELVEEIQKLNPTPRELKLGLQTLIDTYGKKK